jgi:protein-disulfide isomerase
LAAKRFDRNLRTAKTVLDIAGSIAMLVIALILGSSLLRSGSDPVVRVDVANAIVEGDAEAPVTIVVYTDFQCPFCARFARDTLPILRERYVEPGRVRLAIRHLPLENIHPDAREAAAAAHCAAEQMRFWDMHDRLFADPRHLSPADLGETAQSIGLDRALFGACLGRRTTAQRIDADIAEARRLGITSTPTFLLGTSAGEGHIDGARRLVGAAGIERFAELIDELAPAR